MLDWPGSARGFRARHSTLGLLAFLPLIVPQARSVRDAERLRSLVGQADECGALGAELCDIVGRIEGALLRFFPDEVVSDAPAIRP